MSTNSSFNESNDGLNIERNAPECIRLKRYKFKKNNKIHGKLIQFHALYTQNHRMNILAQVQRQSVVVALTKLQEVGDGSF